jgi:hypothetical protein
MEQTFYIGKGNNITLKEAYNLMSGRAVNKDLTTKEGQVYNAWLQMDFKHTDSNGNHKLKQFHQNYGFNLEQVLAKYPIKELVSEQDKSRLLESLQKGNRQSVTFIQDSKEQKHFVEANPRFKSITVYDSNMQRLGSRQSKDEKQAPGESNTIKQEPKKENRKTIDDNGNTDGPKTEGRIKKKQSHSLS